MSPFLKIKMTFLQINKLLIWYLQEVKSNQSKEVPLVLLGNKGDMVHLRQVSSEEGENFTKWSECWIQIIPFAGDILAKDFDCNFREVAAADQVNEVSQKFCLFI